MSFCANCISGVTHEGTAVGKVEKIGGVDTYVSKPQGDYPKDKAVLFLSDIFGLGLINNKLLADGFARNGFQVYMPDYLNGDPVPTHALSTPGFNVAHFNTEDWFVNHGADKTRPPLDAVIKGLKEQGITSFAAVGYCFGGRWIFNLAFENIIKVGAIAHPSLVKVPDLDKLAATSNAPLLINNAEIDEQFPITSQKKAEEILGGGKYKPGFESIFWPGTTHGFAVRGDVSKPELKTAKEGAFKSTVEFFIKHL